MDYALARRNMVEAQIRTNKVTDQRLLDALASLPREAFAPPSLRAFAYLDEDLPLEGGRSMTEPMILARMIQAAEVGAGDSVLLVGAGRGYSTAVLARLAGSVVAVESDRRLAEAARAALREQAVANATVVDGPLEAGWPDRAPFDVLIVDGAIEFWPERLTAQVAEGGRAVAVVRRKGEPGRVVLGRRRGRTLAQRPVCDANTTLLPGFEQAAGFVF